MHYFLIFHLNSWWLWEKYQYLGSPLNCSGWFDDLISPGTITIRLQGTRNRFQYISVKSSYMSLDLPIENVLDSRRPSGHPVLEKVNIIVHLFKNAPPIHFSTPSTPPNLLVPFNPHHSMSTLVIMAFWFLNISLIL